MADKVHSANPAGMVEGQWRPIRYLTFAQALSAASILRAYLSVDSQQVLDAATRLAQSHPLVDVADCFCDGIAHALELEPADRPAAIVRMYSNCQFAAGAR